MQVIIAEKPSVAREIAAIVGAKNRLEGYIEGNGYVVTWAFGHLIQLAMPQQYGIEGFKAENLPILLTKNSSTTNAMSSTSCMPRPPINKGVIILSFVSG